MSRLRLLLFILLSATYHRVSATHIVGGEITYERDSTGAYNVVLTVYRDCGSGNAAFPSGVYIYMRDASNNNTLTWKYVYGGTVVSVPQNINASCVTGLPTFCVEKRTYSTTMTYSGSTTNGVVFDYTVCCRNNTISNLVNPGNLGMKYRAEVYPAGTLVPNTSPVYTIDPPTIVAAGRPTTVNFNAYDADGDSLWYEWTNALHNNGNVVNYVTGYSGTYPLPSSPAATINGNTGIISANVNQTGQYVISVKITEYRSGVALGAIYRDYQFNIAQFSQMSIVIDSLYQPIGCNSGGLIGVDVTLGNPPFTYTWNTGDSTSTLANQPPGTYVVAVEDVAGCIDSAVFILADPGDILSSFTVTPTTCDLSADGGIQINALGPNGPFNYAIGNLTDTTGILTGLDTGYYPLVVTDTGGWCIVDTFFVISALNNWNQNTVDVLFDPSCASSQNGAILLNGIDSTLLYTWSTGATTPNLDSLAAGTYTLLIEEPQSGCVDSLSATLVVDTLTLTALSAADASCDYASDGQSTLHVSGGALPLSYALNGMAQPPTLVAGDSATFSNLSPGAYYVAAIDANGCEVGDSIALGGPEIWHSYVLDSVGPPLCFGDNDGFILFDSTFANSLSIVWNDGSNSLNRTNLSGGSYTLYLSNPAGCADTFQFTVADPQPLQITALTTSDASCNAANDGTCQLSLSGGTAPYTYVLQGQLATGPNFTNLSLGNYSVLVSDTNGCQVDSVFSIFSLNNWNMAAFDIISDPSCATSQDGYISLNGVNSAHQYNWSNGASTSSIDSLNAGSYSVIIQDPASGCVDTLSTALVVDTLVFNALTAVNASCDYASDGQATIFFNGGALPISFALNGSPQSPTVVSTDSALFTNLSPGTYLVAAIDANGCEVGDSMDVAGPETWHSYILDSIYEPLCFGDNDGFILFDSTFANSVSVSWSDGASNINRTQLSGGNYTLYITNPAGCADTLQFNVAAPQPLQITALATSDASCNAANDGTCQLSLSGGTAPYTYVLQGQLATGPNFTNLSLGNYSVLVSDTNGCTVDTSFSISYLIDWYNLQLGQAVEPDCAGDFSGSLLMTTSDGLPPNTNFFWTDDPNAPLNRVGLPAGTYALVVSTGTGCSDTLHYTLNEPDSLETTVQTATEICFGDGLGSISLTPSGGTPPYSFVWNGINAPNLPVLSNASAGTYYPTVLDAKNCFWSAPVVLPGPQPLVVTAVAQPPLSCGSNDGQIQISAVGGVLPYTINVNGQSSGALYPFASAGVNTLTLVDANGCGYTQEFDLEPLNKNTVYIPNAFSPNDDGTNESFEIKGDAACFTHTSFSIFDRWGNEVFTTTEPFVEFWKGVGADASATEKSNDFFTYRFTSAQLAKTGTIYLYR